MFSCKEATALRIGNALSPEDRESEDPGLGSQSPYDDAAETQRRVQRGDESKGDPNERDQAGDYAHDIATSDPARDQGLVRRDIPS